MLEDFLSAWSKTMHVAQLMITAYASQSVLPGMDIKDLGLRFCSFNYILNLFLSDVIK